MHSCTAAVAAAVLPPCPTVRVHCHHSPACCCGSAPRLHAAARLQVAAIPEAVDVTRAAARIRSPAFRPRPISAAAAPPAPQPSALPKRRESAANVAASTQASICVCAQQQAPGCSNGALNSCSAWPTPQSHTRGLAAAAASGPAVAPLHVAQSTTAADYQQDVYVEEQVDLPRLHVKVKKQLAEHHRRLHVDTG